MTEELLKQADEEVAVLLEASEAFDMLNIEPKTGKRLAKLIKTLADELREREWQPIKKVYQTKFNQVGNCFPACLATLLGVPIAEIPDVQFDATDWHNNIDIYLQEKHGLALLFISAGNPKGFYICSGTTKRSPDINHAMIYEDGKLWHDPMKGASRKESEIVRFLDICVLVKTFSFQQPKEQE